VKPSRPCLIVLIVLLASLLVGVPVASALAPAPGLVVEPLATPTVFSNADEAECLAHIAPGVSRPPCDTYQAWVRNDGAAATSGPVTISETLPAGLTVRQVELFWVGHGADAFGLPLESDIVPYFEDEFGLELCSAVTATVTCTVPLPIAPDDELVMVIDVTTPTSSERQLTSTASVSGGESPPQSASVDNSVGSGQGSFGAQSFTFHSSALNGQLDRVAADHPYELSVGLGLQTRMRQSPQGSGLETTSAEDLKDAVVDLPLGFLGSILAAPQCTLTQLSSEAGCPRNTRVGHIRGDIRPESLLHSDIWNLVPEKGTPAQFGFLDVLRGPHVLTTHVVPTPAGYVLQTVVPDTPQIPLEHSVTTFFGNPAEKDETGNAQIPFFTNPAICSGQPLTATIHLDSWVNPARFNTDGTPDLSDPAWVSKQDTLPPMTGCNQLTFAPELHAQPTTEAADTPSGMNLEFHLPQTELAGLQATPPLRSASVTFPEGFTINAAAGNGLAGCSEAQIGWTGPKPDQFNQSLPQCPPESKVGSLELTSPLIDGTLTGAMYLARQNENPFASVFALYVVVNDPRTGVLIKLAGKVTTDPLTGRLTGSFDENPQLPFETLRLHFSSGPRAVFATPAGCGVYSLTSDLAPWSAPDSGLDATPSASFQINTGCVNGFSPTFTAGSTNLQAAAYTSFVASFSRSDTDQELAGLSVSLPPGLLANVGSVPLCPDAQATAGTCPEASQVGTVKAGAGPGPNPLFVTGKAYLTGPYKGAPYGLSVVVPAIAGPFNFGNVVVRQALRIDPNDAHATDVSDPFPTILRPTGNDGQTDGIPIRLRRIDVSIDRPGFTFNPTSCSKLQVGGSLTSTQGATSTLATPFQVTNCATLKFAPKFAVSTSGKTSKANGASLTVKLAYPNAPQGSQANIARVKVDLPKQLPSRLTTLQQACTAAQFNTDPAGCPAASIIGHAVVHTPILPQPLTGPAIFVSHGGEAFPSLIMVLQGNGVTLDLVGSTFISKTGITSSTFKTVPDAPVGTFELTLPQGKFSALAANGNLCTSTLAMPTEFLAQNGLKINESTPVSVTGCAKKKSLTRAQKLAAALKACKKKSKAKRAACQASAHRRYGPSARKKSRGKGGRKG
jgi:hypothetical protein